jgi:hypothetical protein
MVISLIAIFGAALLSIDFGSAWAARRNVITGTDATALDQARAAAVSANPTTCTGAWTDYLYRNVSNVVAASTSCVLHPDPAHPGTGYVTVEARRKADTRFGGLFGFNGDQQPYSLSAAQYGYVTKPKGLRPMGFCLTNDHIQQWLDLKSGAITQGQYDALKGTGDPGGPDGPDALHFMDPPPDGNIDYPSGYTGGVVHRMYFTKDNPADCGAVGTVPGNWGWIDFNGGSNSNADTKDWILNGYDGEVAVNDCNADGTTGDPCPGDTGSSGGSVSSQLQTLVDNGSEFPIPIFSNATGPGSNANFTIWGFLVIKLRGFKDTGSSASRYFDMEFLDTIVSGKCCSNTSPQPGGPKGVQLCGVDHDAATTDTIIATRCGQ